MSELRRDPITRGWVIFAPNRSKRPSDFFVHAVPDDKPDCPFCPGATGADRVDPILTHDPGPDFHGYPWSVQVLPDKYPLLDRACGYERFGEGMYDLMNGYGSHELIIESPIHGQRLHEFPTGHLSGILEIYQERIIELSRDERIHHVLITRNIGHDAGAHIDHPHSHVVALPVIPKKIREEADGAWRYYEYRQRCLFCDILEQERDERERVVLENESFIAFCPYAGRFPFEVTILPKEHIPRFESTRPDERVLLAGMLRRLLRGLDDLLKEPPLNYIVHSAPTVHAVRGRLEGVSGFYHWHMEILPKLTRVAGFEWGSGFYINPMLPEEAAAHLREALERVEQ